MLHVSVMLSMNGLIRTENKHILVNKNSPEFNRNPFSGFIFGVKHDDVGHTSSYPHDHSVTVLPFHATESKELVRRC
jgi:hypothetical protein